MTPPTILGCDCLQRERIAPPTLLKKKRWKSNSNVQCRISQPKM